MQIFILLLTANVIIMSVTPYQKNHNEDDPHDFNYKYSSQFCLWLSKIKFDSCVCRKSAKQKDVIEWSVLFNMRNTQR